VKLRAFWLAALLLTACGGGARHATVDNPYLEKSRHSTQSGMNAMQDGRWRYARISFTRALTAAQLTDSPALVARAWYNLGMARRSDGQTETAQTAFRTARRVAEQHHDTLTALRARLALALLQVRPTWRPAPLQAKLPADIHLSAARLAQRQHRPKVARAEYEQALKRSDTSRQGLTYKGQAYLGLGLLAEDRASVRHHMQRALKVFRQVGTPSLIAYTLLKISETDESETTRSDHLHRALTIYRALHDKAGEEACIRALRKGKQRQNGPT